MVGKNCLMKRMLPLILLMCGTALCARAETVKVPILFKINDPLTRFRTVGGGFAEDPEKYVWAFQINQLPELLKKDNLSFGYYSDTDNDPKTGLPPWDFMLNIRPKENKLSVLRIAGGKYRGYALYPDDYVIAAAGDMLYVALRKEVVKDQNFGRKFTMRLISNHSNSIPDKDGTIPSFWPDRKIDREKAFGTFEPMFNFQGFQSAALRLTKIPYAVKIGETEGYSIWNFCGEHFEENEKMPPVIAEEKILRVRAARGEWEAAHLAISAKKPFRTFKVLSGLLKKDSGEEFPPDALKIYYPGYATNAYGKNMTDVLYPVYRPSRSAHHFAVIDAHPPYNLPAGSYRGSLRLEINGKVIKTVIPFEIEVLDFTFPQVRSFKTACHVHPGYPGGGKAGHSLLHQWGFSTQLPYLDGKLTWGPKINIGSNPLLDFSLYDRFCRNFFQKKHQSVCVNTFFMLGSHGTMSKRHWVKTGRKKAIGTDPEADRNIARAAAEFRDYLKKNCWLDKFIFILWDEPYSSVYGDILNTAAIIRKAAPELILGIYIDATQPGLMRDNLIDVWMFPAVNALPNAWKYRQKGQKFWIYNQTGMGSLEYPAAVPRLFYWFAYHKKLDGMLYWCVNFLNKPGRKNGAYLIQATEFTWFYPDADDPQTVYPSLRLLMAREGLDDYEYFKALEKSKRDPSLLQAIGKQVRLDSKTGNMVYDVRSNYELQKIRENMIRQLEADR